VARVGLLLIILSQEEQLELNSQVNGMAILSVSFWPIFASSDSYAAPKPKSEILKNALNNHYFRGND